MRPLRPYMAAAVLLSGLQACQGSRAPQSAAFMTDPVSWTRHTAWTDTSRAGLSGAYAGVSGGMLLLAGGANFPNRPVWQGGTKRLYATIYSCALDHLDTGTLQLLSDTLPEAMGYGAALDVADQLLLIGGETDHGPSAQVLGLRYDPISGRIHQRPFPPLPHPMTMPMAAALGSEVYVAGGLDSLGSTSDFYTLDLEHPDRGWKALPTWPGPSRCEGLLLSGRSREGDSCLYLVGGRVALPQQLSRFQSSLCRFDPKTETWTRLAEIQTSASKAVPWASATGLALPDGRLLLFGGNDGRIYNEIETCIIGAVQQSDAKARASFIQRKDSLMQHHPGFCRYILAYDPQLDRWDSIGDMPFASPVNTQAIQVGKRIIIPMGEVRPGLRSTWILLGALRDSLTHHVPQS